MIFAPKFLHKSGITSNFILNCYWYLRKEGYAAKDAFQAAKNSYLASLRRWEFTWEYDEHHDNGPRDWGWSEDDCRQWEKDSHECFVCVLRDEEGNILDCLAGIWDPSPAYKLDVEGDMAENALWEEARSWGGCAHAR